MPDLKPERVQRIVARHLAGETVKEIAAAMRLKIRTVELAIAGLPTGPPTAIEVAPCDTTLRDELSNRRAELLAKAQVTHQEIAAITRGQLVEVQQRIFGVLAAVSRLLGKALDDEDAHAAQMYAVVLGITVDQSHKILRELRDLEAEAQEDQETGWVVVVREDGAPDGP